MIFKSKNKQKNNFQLSSESGGFTLIELVVAIFILVVAIIGIYNSFSTVVVLTTGVSSRFTAVYLAQEGIEVVRNIRDNNWIQGRTWNDGLLSCENGCEGDYKTGILPGSTLIPWPSDGNYLNIQENNFYSYDATGNYSPTKFKRRITIMPDAVNQDILRVSVLVTWNEKGEEGCAYGYCIEAEEYIYNWY